MSNDYDTFDVAATAIGWAVAFVLGLCLINAVLGYVYGGA